MSFFEKVKERLFGKSANTSPHKPLVTELIARTQTNKNSYLQWMQHGKGMEMQEGVYEAYRQKLLGEVADDYMVHILQMPYANGFAVTYREEVPTQAFAHFFDWLKDRALNLPSYKLVNADRQFFDRGKYVETKEKYYLKPHISSEDQSPFDQRYGNILIEHILIDKQPSYIKFVANIYSDRMYTEALSFQELMNEIFTVAP